MTLGKLDAPDVIENAEETAALEAATADVYPIADRVVRYRKLKEMERDIAERVKETRDEIVGYLRDRDAEFGAVDGQLVCRRRPVTTRRVDTTALKAKEPEIAEQFTRETTSDRLEMIDP
jgi:predicted phage-related endonuclease